MRFSWTKSESDWLSLEGPWRGLYAACPKAAPSQSLDWHEAWRRAVSSHPIALCAWQGDDLFAVWPLEFRMGGFLLRSHAAGPSDCLDPLVFGDDPHLRRILLEELADMKAKVLDLCEQASPYRAGEASALSQSARLLKSIPNDESAFLKSIKASLRRDLKLKPGQRIVHATFDDLELRLHQFFELHARRWRAKGLPGAFALASRRRFLTNWCRRAISTGECDLQFLEESGQPVATAMMLRHGSTCFFYQSGLDPNRAKGSPGTILVGQTMIECVRQGIQTFDFMRGVEAYKLRWEPEQMIQQYRVFMRDDSLSARMIASAMGALHSGEQRVRKRLEPTATSSTLPQTA